MASALSGCAGIMMPLSAWMSKTDAVEPEITGSIPKTGASPTAAKPASDADVVRQTIESAGITGREAPIAWKNETTGNSGTITHVAASRAMNGALCRDFETTLVTVEGVNLHTGRACQGYDGPWDMVRFERVGR